MKKLLLVAVIFIAAMNACLAQNSFASIINDWARYANFNIKTIDESAGVAIIYKQIDGTNQEIMLRTYENFVEFRVLFYSLDEVASAFGNKFGDFIFYLLEMNSEYPYGGWGIATGDNNNGYLGMFYGIPIDKIDKVTFDILTNSLCMYGAEVENILNKANSAKAGLGFADDDSITNILDDIEAATKVHRESILKKFAK